MKKIYFLIICLVVSFSVFVSAIINPSVMSVSDNIRVNKNGDVPIVIIDAGHGGFDGGAVSVDGTPEKNINLSVSLFLNEFLIALGFNTIMTREQDISLEDKGLSTIRSRKTSDIHNRMKIMEDTDNSIFVSIHQNFYTQSKYSGTQVFYSPEFAEDSSLLARCIQESVVTALQPENKREIKRCDSSVFLMYKAVKPAVLVECGFLSNPQEATILKDENYQKKIALCIALGIQDYVSRCCKDGEK